MITKNAPLLSQPNLEINMHTLIISKCTNMQICKTVTITSTNHCCSQKAQWAKTLNLRDALTRSVMGVFDCHNFKGGGLKGPLPETGNNVCLIIKKIIHVIRYDKVSKS